MCVFLFSLRVVFIYLCILTGMYHPMSAIVMNSNSKVTMLPFQHTRVTKIVSTATTTIAAGIVDPTSATRRCRSLRLTTTDVFTGELCTADVRVTNASQQMEIAVCPTTTPVNIVFAICEINWPFRGDVPKCMTPFLHYLQTCQTSAYSKCVGTR